MIKRFLPHLTTVQAHQVQVHPVVGILMSTSPCPVVGCSLVQGPPASVVGWIILVYSSKSTRLLFHLLSLSAGLCLLELYALLFDL